MRPDRPLVKAKHKMGKKSFLECVAENDPELRVTKALNFATRFISIKFLNCVIGWFNFLLNAIKWSQLVVGSNKGFEFVWNSNNFSKIIQTIQTISNNCFKYLSSLFFNYIRWKE